MSAQICLIIFAASRRRSLSRWDFWGSNSLFVCRRSSYWCCSLRRLSGCCCYEQVLQSRAAWGEERRKKKEQLTYEDLWLKWLPGTTCLRFLRRKPFLDQPLHYSGFGGRHKGKTRPLEAVFLMWRDCGTNPQCVHCHTGLNRSHPDWNSHIYCISHLHPG